MTENNSSDFSIRNFESSDTNRVIFIWEQCGLVRSWNNPNLDIQRKLSFQKDLFFIGELNNEIIATAMFGYDGHRDWLNYFAVIPKYQKKGFGRKLLNLVKPYLLKRVVLN